MRRLPVLPNSCIEVSGPGWLEDRFAREYEGPHYPAEETALAIRFGDHRQCTLPWKLEGRHKSMGWTACIGDPTERPVRAEVTLLGWPKSFATALVQSFILEPIVTHVAADDGVLASAAGIEERGTVLLLLGGSGTGKSSLTARALASGRNVLGDDQVYVRVAGDCWSFPRRLRVYNDLIRTAPEAYDKLPFRLRAALRIRGAIRTATRSYIAPSLAVSPELLGHVIWDPLPLGRVVVLTRRAHGTLVTLTPIESGRAAEVASQHMARQRQHLYALGGPWSGALQKTLRAEKECFTELFARVPTFELTVPDHRDPGAVVAQSANALGFD